MPTFASATTTPPPTVESTRPRYEIEMLSAGCRRSSTSYVECSGAIVNLTGAPIPNLTAVVVWTDMSGKPLRFDDALVEYRPVLPGQQSPWRIIASYNPALVPLRFEFKTDSRRVMVLDQRFKVSTELSAPDTKICSEYGRLLADLLNDQIAGAAEGTPRIQAIETLATSSGSTTIAAAVPGGPDAMIKACGLTWTK